MTLNGEQVRVVIADDHHLVRKGFRALLEHEPDIEVVAEAVDGREAMQQVERFRPDVLIMDLQMPGMSGLEAVHQLRGQESPVRVLVLTMHKDAERILQVLRAGAAGYILKDSAVSDLVEGIRTVARGEVFLSPAVSTRVVTDLIDLLDSTEITSPLDMLTDREREVLQLIAEGNARRDIAELLYISPKTVDTHRSNLMGKLGARSEADLVRVAIRHGLVSLET
jgi:DNA-binding NarL/FixJ family response regulator